MGNEGKQEQTYRLPGVQDAEGQSGTLVFTVKPGGNTHAEFEPDAQATQLPSNAEQAGQVAGETGEGAPPAPSQQPS